MTVSAARAVPSERYAWSSVTDARTGRIIIGSTPSWPIEREAALAKLHESDATLAAVAAIVVNIWLSRVPR